jgi:hypothetical protein
MLTPVVNGVAALVAQPLSVLIFEVAVPQPQLVAQLHWL